MVISAGSRATPNVVIFGHDDSSIVVHSFNEALQTKLTVALAKGRIGLPVNELAFNGASHVAAATASSLAVYDVVRQTRFFSHSMGINDSANTCKFITPNVMACCGDGHRLLVVDARTNRVAMNCNIASDNLYCLTWDLVYGFSVGGADGCIYQVDFRNECAVAHELPEDGQAVVSLAQQDGYYFVVLESGHARVLSAGDSHSDYLWRLDYRATGGFSTKVGSDFSIHGDCFDGIYGSDNGKVTMVSGRMGGVSTTGTTYPVGIDPVPFLELEDERFYAGCGESLHRVELGR